VYNTLNQGTSLVSHSVRILVTGRKAIRGNWEPHDEFYRLIVANFTNTIFDFCNVEQGKECYTVTVDSPAEITQFFLTANVSDELIIEVKDL